MTTREVSALLATLLPGLRDVRVPLATGFLWLTFAWLLVARAIPNSSELTGLLFEIDRAVAALGSTALVAALSFVAYIVGVMTTFRARSLFRTSLYVMPAILRLYPETLVNSIAPGARKHIPELLKRTGVALSATSGDALERKAREVLADLALAGVSARRVMQVSPALATSWDLSRQRLKLDDTDSAFWGWVNERGSMHLVSRDVVADFEHNSRALKRANSEDYGEFDRLQAEAEFRISVALPLSATIIVCATYLPFREFDEVWQILIFFLTGAVVAIVFFGFLARSLQKFGEANDIVADAIVSGTISSPTLEGLVALRAEVPLRARMRARIGEFVRMSKRRRNDGDSPELPA